jgi:hypothetical protein
MKDGGWLDQYQEGGVAKTDATRVAAPALKLTKAQLEKNKAINKQVMVNTEKVNAKKLAERKKAVAESSEADIINPNGKRFAIGDKFRMFPNDVSGVGEMFDDYINPAVAIGNTASGLGNAMIDRDAGALAIEAGVALGAGALGFDPLGGVMKAIPNTYKINPWAFKANPEAYYRTIGKEGYKDAINSRVLRAPSTSRDGLAWYNRGTPHEYVKGSDYIAEVTNHNLFEKHPYRHPDYAYSKENIPLGDNTRLLKKDWLQGYKPVEIPKKENGGWLDEYNDGGPVQPNYNDYSVSAGPGFQGDGYSNVGRNYSPAWGGQFEDGGNLSFISNPKLRNMLEGYKPGFMDSVGDYRLPGGQIIPLRDPSSEVSISVGGGDGEPAYLIPSFKYGQPLQDPVQEFNMTEQYLGGPFKTVDDAETFRELRHQYVDKGQPLPSPIATSNMAMGGFIGGATQGIPGATGFMYARTGSIPSNGKYAKKTKASAQNGTEMKFYQEGLDFKPKSISRDGDNIAYSDNTRVGNIPRYTRPSNYQGNQPDTLGENIFEIIDPSGISSWDDIYRSYNKTGMSGQTAIEAFGAIPFLGKATKFGKAVDALSTGFAVNKRQKRNAKVAAELLKATGKYGPGLGRASDAAQAYAQRNDYEQGGQLTKLDQLSNFTNYNTKQPGSWLDKYQ